MTKDENYYVSNCNSHNKLRTTHGYSGNFTTYHEVEDKIVELRQTAVSSSDGDIDYELNEVVIHNNILCQIKS